MTRINAAGHGPSGTRDRLPTRTKRLVFAVLAAVGLLSMGAASASAGTVTLPGAPLSVSVGSLGQCQSSYPNIGTNFFPPSSTEGDCGFFLAFPKAAGQSTKLEDEVYGFPGAAGPGIGGGTGVEYTAEIQGPVTGSGTSADPYAEETKYKVEAEEKEFAEITDRTTYISGEPQFTSTYTVENVTGKGGSTEVATELFFHAIVAGDLFVSNDDHGTGVFLGGPPKFIGGQNPNVGTLGGFIEATPAWTNYQEGYWDGPFTAEGASAEDLGIWNAVRTSPTSASVFNDTIDPALLDNGAGVSWDDHLTKGLKSKETTSYTIVNRSQVPTTLGVQPVTQSHTVGQTATVTVTATDNVGTPYGGRPLVYSIGGANPKTGSVTTNASGVATISYVGTAAGLDTMQMFLDLNGNGSQDNGEPSSAAQIIWTPAPPTPNSSYKIQSIHANSNGTVTITFVPTQEGTALVVVTVPTATISRNAIAAKRQKKCKKGQARIKGKCRPTTSVSGKVSAKGKAGVPLKITVQPSRKVKAALKKGKKVQLTAKLTYTSVLGGTPTVQTFHFTVKAPKKKKKKH
jgi:hypothetical protein